MNPKTNSNIISDKKITNQNSIKDDENFAFLQGLQSELQAQKSTVTDGWDAVSFISAGAINKLWESRWEKELDDSYKGVKQFLQNMQVTTTSTFAKLELKVDLTMQFGPPLLNFLPHEPKNVAIKIPIMKASMIEYVNGEKQDEKKFESTKNNSYYLNTQCPLSSFDGEVGKNGGVCIYIANGTFMLEGFSFDPLIDANLREEITEAIQNQGLPPWNLGSLKYDFEEEYLKPKKFFFNTYCYDDKKPSELDILGIYILTTTEKEPPNGMRKTWGDAWVIGKECNAAVYFSPKLLMDYEINSAFMPYFGPIDSNTDYSNKSFINPIKLYEQKITCQVGYSNPSGSYINDVEENASVTLPSSSIKFNFDIEGFSLTCNAAWDESFPYQWTKVFLTNMNYQVYYGPYSFTCSFHTTHVEPSINKNTFIISFPEVAINDPVAASATPKPGEDAKGGKWEWDNSKYAPESFATGAIEGIKRQFQNVKIQLKAMPMFAVSNILFPEGKMLNPQKVAFPCDMVIVGTALEEYSPLSK